MSGHIHFLHGLPRSGSRSNNPTGGSQDPPPAERLRKGMSIVMQDGSLALSGLVPEEESQKGGGGSDVGGVYRDIGKPVTEPTLTKRRAETARAVPLPKRTFSFDTSLQRRGQIHLQSADLFDTFSPVQKARQDWRPQLPEAFERSDKVEIHPVDAPELIQRDPEELKRLNPRTFGLPCVEITPAPQSQQHHHLPSSVLPRAPLRAGLVLSGGPAPGGHNVIAGVYDYIKAAHTEAQLVGFMGGLDGLFAKRFTLVDDQTMHRFRNQGGFDMLWSGRGRVNGATDLQLAATVCKELQLDGLIIVGGDGSNSNAALLAEFFAEHCPDCAVIGVPKTIDGDLRNPWIETSFGFDTAAKTYSELIGNLCTDVTTAQQTYHFVRVMGRSASHLVLECALQTRPNMVFIGEEVQKLNLSLRYIVASIADLIERRLAAGKPYGIILVPEGLIEFIPEFARLIDELNSLLAGTQPASVSSAQEVTAGLSGPSREVWESLTDIFQEQLLMDREASGYIQVAKIATERLLRVQVEAELHSRGIDIDAVPFMTHYFGYEGRCAMPSNFDANYCYALGHTAGALIEHRRNGYMTVVRGLEHNPAWWRPSAVPFTRVMEMKTAPDGSRYPAVTRQLVDLEGQLFKALVEVREQWLMEDCYRAPGPVQFEGAVADIADHTVALPAKEDLLWGPADELQGVGRAVCPKRIGCLSPLQRARLRYKPELPEICIDPQARATEGAQYLPKDPFTLRQILLYYPYLCKNNKFALTHIESCRDEAPIEPGLTVGIVFLSRQSPGVANVLWGVHERMRIVGGRTLGFYGTDGLMNGKYLEICDGDLELIKNQGGMELLGRSDKHSLLVRENQERARVTCEQLRLDGLIIVGSSLAVTEAALTAEYFLAKNSNCSIIAVPATGSNNLTHDLIETNIGFDTSSKLYAGLIGNVLTDAASMPKYWHFVRLMGRQPSNEVLECALQTHPNVCIIAEEYGSANKNLADVVSDVADVVCERAAVGKNFGSVLIPDGLLSHLPNMKALIHEFAGLVREAERAGQLKDLQRELDLVGDGAAVASGGAEADASSVAGGGADGGNNNGGSGWRARVTPWSLALFKSLPRFIRKELTQVDMGEMRFTLLETELLLSQMVRQELARRAKAGKYKGKFAAVCHFFGYQGRSSMPSQFDCRLAFAYGHLAAICVESGLRSHCCTIRGLVGDWREWKLSAIPFNCMFSFVATQDDVHPDLKQRQGDMPIIASAEVKLDGKAYNWMKAACGQWRLQDRFCNPGPVQFSGAPSNFYHRMLHEEQAEYYEMLRAVQLYSEILRSTCSFGVDEQFLRVAFSQLHGLLALRFHDHDLLRFLPPVAEFERAVGAGGGGGGSAASPNLTSWRKTSAVDFPNRTRSRSVMDPAIAKRLMSAAPPTPPV